MTDIDRDNIEESYIDFNSLISKIFYRITTILMILIIVLNIMICVVLVYYGNILAFLFIVNIFYIISYYRMMKKEKMKNDLG